MASIEQSRFGYVISFSKAIRQILLERNWDTAKSDSQPFSTEPATIHESSQAASMLDRHRRHTPVIL
jgi:hypothetical protein